MDSDNTETTLSDGRISPLLIHYLALSSGDRCCAHYTAHFWTTRDELRRQLMLLGDNDLL